MNRLRTWPRRAAGWLDDRHRVGLLALALALAPLTTLRLYAADEIQYFAYLRSLVFDADLDFSDEYRWFAERDPAVYEGFTRTFLVPKTPAGRAPNNAPIGSAMLWAPFYVPTVAAESVLGRSASPAGYSRADVAAVCIASMLYGVIGLLLTQEACRRFATPRASFWAVVLIWLGTNLLFYMYVTPPMSHADAFFAAALFFWYWLRTRAERGSPLVLGLIGALVASVRWQDALFALAPLSGAWLAGEIRDARSLRRWLGWAARFAVGLFVGFVPQLVVWWRLNGSLTPFGVIAVKGRFAFTAPYLVGVLFSSFHGLLVWTPILLPAFVGLGALAVRDGRGRALAAAVAAQLYLLSGYVVAFGHGFGQRLFVSSLPVAAIGLAAFGDRVAPRIPRVVLWTGALLCVWWNLSLVVQHSTGMIPRDRGVTLGTLVHNQLVEVPRRLPRIAARYLFDRSSFYQVDPLRRPQPGRES